MRSPAPWTENGLNKGRAGTGYGRFRILYGAITSRSYRERIGC